MFSRGQFGRANRFLVGYESPLVQHRTFVTKTVQLKNELTQVGEVPSN
jgi:hypothetical protein